MAYVTKQIETGHGVIADCWWVKMAGPPDFDEATGFYTLSANIHLYASVAARDSGKVLLDNGQVSYSNIMEAEFDAIQGGVADKTVGVLYTRLLTPVMGVDEEGNAVNTNYFSTSHSGSVTLVGGVFTP